MPHFIRNSRVFFYFAMYGSARTQKRAISTWLSSVNPTLEFPQPNVARAVLRRFFILFQQSRHIQLHDEQAHEHQRRAEIAAHRQALAEQE